LGSRSSSTPGVTPNPKRALQELIAKSQTDSAYQVAEVCGARGEVDIAFDCRELAYAQRDPGLTETKINPRLRSLHADPRWGARLPAQMGLADQTEPRRRVAPPRGRSASIVMSAISDSHIRPLLAVLKVPTFDGHLNQSNTG